MGASTYRSYEEAASDYLTKFQALRDAPPSKSDAVTRGAGDIQADVLINRADEIADVSASMVSLSKNYIEAPDPKLREGISGQLLAQAAAELQVATELLEIAEEGQTGQVATRTTRSTRGMALRDAINMLEKSMATPVSTGLNLSTEVRRAGVASPATKDNAKSALEQAAYITTGSISQRVIELGGDMAFNLVFSTEWKAVIDSTGVVSGGIANLLEGIKEGIGAFFTRVVTVAAKTLANVYDKILALLGKDVEDLARKKIQEWLEAIKEKGKIELFDALASKLYRIDEFKKELGDWLEETTAEVDRINQITEEVNALSEKFSIFFGRMKKLSDIAGLAKFIKAPQVIVVLTGVRIALLAVLVYGGYDYVGYKQMRFPNLTKGVAEVIQENLVPQE